ncbi:hypothetical protein [Paraglaciecola sp. L3A3]|uniref:hypothetical protein n=1 Tax=Paraglaciecola sp. L3A3 TaxID=2686358 RepID=UPI00131A78B1|nr:hypothetical protein [Paraglaciecola sp. L3A3]
MYDFMQVEKAQLAQAKTHAEVARKYSQRCMTSAQEKTKSFASSPAGIATAFSAGAFQGATNSQAKSPISSLLPILLRLF